MTERYLQSLAILLAGLFSAERARSKGKPPGPILASVEAEQLSVPADGSKSN